MECRFGVSVGRGEVRVFLCYGLLGLLIRIFKNITVTWAKKSLKAFEKENDSYKCVI